MQRCLSALNFAYQALAFSSGTKSVLFKMKILFFPASVIRLSASAHLVPSGSLASKT